MGGPSYDRDDDNSTSSSSSSSTRSSSSSWYSSGSSLYSSNAKTKMSATTLDSSMKPNSKTIVSSTHNPIVIVLDVTGSNIDFARVLYDKLPMLHGQIEQKGYLEDFDLCICAVGDVKYDAYPLQIASFAQGKEIDSWIEKIVLEGGGGGNKRESYDLAAYYLLKNFEFAEDAKPIIFFIGDEMPYDCVSSAWVHSHGIRIDNYEELENPFQHLRNKVNDNVYMLLNQYCGNVWVADITSCWEKLLAPQHVIKIHEEKSVVDLMLGIISLSSSARTLETYRADLVDKGQTNERIRNVMSSLEKLEDRLAAERVENVTDESAPESPVRIIRRPPSGIY